ncbi:depupylase/deamidase Dop [Arsenicicoccus dermatophilus]|uniref:depupylase/deamidase Dop n=1 Tax=Arsenicicoccus dermatophilus TaxID=1076331 RepID=UPI001F4D13CC|nr:depupylase/deamidase Dop [Arsenicicoccus dermatophilus]MCH8612498.1 proteasome accessory factor PafA2 [Arsenicicoccus dermatophilus]
MSVRRVMGIETEYGISVPGEPHANPVVLSGLIVNAYATRPEITVSRTRWDYEAEQPLHDQFGQETPRAWADPSQLTDEDDEIAANVVLTNGARLYVDHAHPEYSSPEVTNPHAAVVWDRAGEQIMAEAVNRQAYWSGRQINLYKNNTDGKGNSYGTHENYLVERAVPFTELAQHILPFFVARQVLCGAGRVGIGPESQQAGFQISQRADFFERAMGLETTVRRGIVNTRDEPHADPTRWRRLHVIIGDANQAETATLLKMGTTSLVLSLIEQRDVTRNLSLADPVAALQQISRDPSLRTTVELYDGRRMTALDILWAYYEMVDDQLSRVYGSELDQDTNEIMHRWDHLMVMLGTEPEQAASQVDWVAKLALLEQYRSRDGLAWDDAKLRAMDIQWSDVRPDKGLHHKLEDAGHIDRIEPPQLVDAATTMPPEDTRGWLRGTMVRRFPHQVMAASWDSIVVRTHPEAPARRINLPDPWQFTREQLQSVVDGCLTAGELADRIEQGLPSTD